MSRRSLQQYPGLTAEINKQCFHETSRTVAIASIVPTKHVDIALEEEVEPVGVRTGDHLLVVESVGVAHDHGGLGDVLRLHHV